VTLPLLFSFVIHQHLKSQILQRLTALLKKKKKKRNSSEQKEAQSIHDKNSTRGVHPQKEEVPLVEFMSLLFTCMPGDSYCR